MRIVFESQFYPDSLLTEYESKSKGILDYAANNLCKSIIDGLKRNNQVVFAVNSPNLGSFPFLYKSLFVKGAIFDDCVTISFLNISHLKRFFIRRKLKREIIKQIEAYPTDESICLLLYNFRCLSLVDSLKKRFPQLTICMVVTDLPEFMQLPESRFLSFLKEKISRGSSVSHDKLKAIDCFVLLAPALADRMGINDKPWIQVEGIYNSEIEINEEDKETTKTILYSGNLGLRYGIGTLLEAFHRIESEDYRLWLCGGGDGLDMVKRYCEFDSRVIYKGILPRADVLRLQKRATVLVNPRNSYDDYTRYSFPSKTMEYLASGTPVIMSHLQSIPKEYDSYIFYVQNESIDGFKNKIIEICSMSFEELKEFGQRASHFVYERKTSVPQMAKVIDFIKTQI